MSRSVSVFSVVVVVTVTVLATVAVAFAVPGEGSNGQEKVEVCHKGKIITVAEPAVPAHLAHGDNVGACTLEENEGALPEEPSEGATPELTTEATTEATLPDDPISDTATLSGATNDATGTITFSAYGPFDPATDPTTDVCDETTLAYESPDPVDIGSPDATSGNYVVSSDDPAVTTDDFVPTEAGRYQWVASYSSGDETKNISVSTECNDPNEQSVVNEASSTTGTEQNMTLAAEIGENIDPADPATDTSNIEDTNQNDNTTLGTDSDDHLTGDSSANILLSRDGQDFLDGGQGADRMVGGAQVDYINAADGKPGNDVINGGIGTDYCVGDKGDTFKNCDGNVVKVPLPSESAAPVEASN